MQGAVQDHAVMQDAVPGRGWRAAAAAALAEPPALPGSGSGWSCWTRGRLRCSCDRCCCPPTAVTRAGGLKSPRCVWLLLALRLLCLQEVMGSPVWGEPSSLPCCPALGSPNRLQPAAAPSFAVACAPSSCKDMLELLLYFSKLHRGKWDLQRILLLTMI